jgi:hypothetical protein
MKTNKRFFSFAIKSLPEKSHLKDIYSIFLHFIFSFLLANKNVLKIVIEMTHLESLANEFFDTIQLFRAFHGLNSRFDNLLFNHFQAYRLDFRSLTKYNFNKLCDEYLPEITASRTFHIA